VSAQADVERRWYRPKSTSIGLGRFLESAMVDVERSRSEWMPSGVGLSLWRAELGGVDMQRIRPKSMSSRVGPCRCQVESAQVDVEKSWPRLMSPQSRPKSTWADIGWSLHGSMSTEIGPC